MSGIKEFIKEYPISDIKPHPRNPRVHPESAIEKLQRSIQEFGFVNPVLLSKDGMLLAGHARVKASKAEQREHVPALILDLDGEKGDAYLIADNKLQEETDWDLPVLKDLLSELDAGEFDIELTGFELPEIDELLNDYDDSLDESEADEDQFNVDEAMDEGDPITKRGDIWLLGEHRLVCGDSTNPEEVNTLLNGKTADMVFTDPPYGVSAMGGRSQTIEQRNMEKIKNDELRADQLTAFLTAAFANFQVKDGGSIYICYDWRTQSEFTEAIRDSGFVIKNCIIWDKKNFGLGLKGYRPQFEMIYFCTPTPSYDWYGGSDQSDIWQFAREIDRESQGNHPTPKPIKLIGKAINNSSERGHLVLDLFAGSGSTLIAAEQTGRTAYLMELDEKYCDVIVRRWEEYTGEKAVREHGQEIEANS